MNGHTVEATYKFVNSDVLEHSLHRHEPPVSAQTITVVKDDGDVIVVDKPASIPVRGCGAHACVVWGGCVRVGVCGGYVWDVRVSVLTIVRFSLKNDGDTQGCLAGSRRVSCASIVHCRRRWSTLSHCPQRISCSHSQNKRILIISVCGNQSAMTDNTHSV